MPLERLIAEDRLTEIPGIGDALAAVITNLHKTGEHPSLEKMRAETPEGVLEMLRLPGLRPDRIKKLYTNLGIASVADLEEAARSDRLKSIKGFGPAFQAKVLQGIEMSRRPQGRHLHRAAAAFSYPSFATLYARVGANLVRKGRIIPQCRARGVPQKVSVHCKTCMGSGPSPINHNRVDHHTAWR